MPKTVKSPVHQIFDYYSSKFKEKTGHPYLFQFAKDGKLIKDLLLTYTLPQLKQFIDTYFSSKDEFVVRTGYAFNVFKYKINSLAAGEGYRDGEEEAYFTDTSRQEYIRSNWRKYQAIYKATKGFSVESTPEWDKGYVTWAKNFWHTLEQYPRIIRDLQIIKF